MIVQSSGTAEGGGFRALARNSSVGMGVGIGLGCADFGAFGFCPKSLLIVGDDEERV